MKLTLGKLNPVKAGMVVLEKVDAVVEEREGKREVGAGLLSR